MLYPKHNNYNKNKFIYFQHNVLYGIYNVLGAIKLKTMYVILPYGEVERPAPTEAAC